MSIVELEHVSLVRQGVRILSDVCWTIQEGQHWVLLGANGSGKTALLKVITGCEWPTTGSVTVLRHRYGQCNLPELRKAIGWVSNAIEQRLPGKGSAIDVVVSGFYASIGLYQEPTAEQWHLAGQVLRRIGAEHVMKRPFELLAQGEQQRTLIARALVNRPSLLILDEPCAGLDPVAREGFLGDLERWATSSDAPVVVFVTHHIEEIGPWITNALVLNNGAVLAAGRTAGVLTAPVLSQAFGRPCEVGHLAGRFTLLLKGPREVASG